LEQRLNPFSSPDFSGEAFFNRLDASPVKKAVCTIKIKRPQRTLTLLNVLET